VYLLGSLKYLIQYTTSFQDSDDEYDQYGRKKRRKTQNGEQKEEEKEEPPPPDDDDDDEEESGDEDLSKYDLDGDEDEVCLY